MPATSQTSVSQILKAASQDKREQPWKKALVVDSARAESGSDKEIVKTDGTIGPLTNFFTS